jgi:hypothetical protein
MNPTRPLLAALVFSLTLISMTCPAWAEPVVLFDMAHGERFLPGDEGPLGLSTFAGALKGKGVVLTPHKETITDTALAGKAGIIISGPFAPFAPAEIDALVRYVEQGGAVAIMLHIAPPAAPLLHRLGVASANGVIREQQRLIGNEPLNFNVKPAAGHLLMKGVESLSFYGAWALLPVASHAQTIAATSEHAWIDRDGDRKLTPPDGVQSFAVAVDGTLGKGRFVVFGDDAIFQNQFLKDGNRILATNLAQWLIP